jgi:hypothetical protein
MFSMEAGQYHPVTHNQSDKASFTLYGLGARWAIDSGYGNTRQPGDRDQTVAHNAILVDGAGQALAGRGIGTSGQILAFADGKDFGYCLADATDAYRRNSRNQPGIDLRRALRHGIFFRPRKGVPAYAVVLDDIEKDDAPHRYTWLLHTAPENQVQLRQASAVVVPGVASGNAYVDTRADRRAKGKCGLQFSVQRGGLYTVWARVRSLGPQPHKADSFYVQMDDGPRLNWDIPAKPRWTWARVRDAAQPDADFFRLAAGSHALRFSTRETGAQMDQIALVPGQSEKRPVLDPQSVILKEAESCSVTSPVRVVRHATPSDSPRMVIQMGGIAEVDLREDVYDGHPVLKAVSVARNPRFAAVLLPLPSGVSEPRVTVRSTSSPPGMTITLHWSKEAVDQIRWPFAEGARPVVERR